jgi:hypothetical protein
LPRLEFDREMLLVAAMGARSSGGYRIEIVSATEHPTEIVARVVETAPGRRCGTIQAITEPADIVRLARSDKPVRWAVEQVVEECP